MKNKHKNEILKVLDRLEALLDERPMDWKRVKRYVRLCRIRLQHMDTGQEDDKKR